MHVPWGLALYVLCVVVLLPTKVLALPDFNITFLNTTIASQMLMSSQFNMVDMDFDGGFLCVQQPTCSS
jgi:hypothetical protein